MKKIGFTIITVLIMQAGFSQTNSGNQTTLDSISKVVIHYLQAKQADSIYALSRQNFRNKLTKENFNLYQSSRCIRLMIFSM